eukprot:2393345-Amphidinium_carterae.1
MGLATAPIVHNVPIGCCHWSCRYYTANLGVTHCPDEWGTDTVQLALAKIVKVDPTQSLQSPTILTYDHHL